MNGVGLIHSQSLECRKDDEIEQKQVCQLPLEIILKIFAFTGPIDFHKATLINRTLRQIILAPSLSNQNIWKNYCAEEGVATYFHPTTETNWLEVYKKSYTFSSRLLKMCSLPFRHTSIEMCEIIDRVSEFTLVDGRIYFRHSRNFYQFDIKSRKLAESVKEFIDTASLTGAQKDLFQPHFLRPPVHRLRSSESGEISVNDSQGKIKAELPMINSLINDEALCEVLDHKDLVVALAKNDQSIPHVHIWNWKTEKLIASWNLKKLKLLTSKGVVDYVAQLVFGIFAPKKNLGILLFKSFIKIQHDVLFIVYDSTLYFWDLNKCQFGGYVKLPLRGLYPQVNDLIFHDTTLIIKSDFDLMILDFNQEVENKQFLELSLGPC